MPGITEASLSILTSTLPTRIDTSLNAVFAPLIIFGIVVVVVILRYASPLHLTRVLVIAITVAEKTYIDAIETGLLSLSDMHTAEMLSSLQLKVSDIREVTLRNSLSWRTAQLEVLKGCTLILLRCICEVRNLEAHIEV
ncbi:hypothetical protein B0H13DRAFT_2322310 [Mycena leptocephala]|nr:hypothetical protein B0H13DRAFT_2322310 [Mycena leptocephala]